MQRLVVAEKDEAGIWAVGQNSGQRIAKWLAKHGPVSRREAEQCIAQGRVCVDGEVVTTPVYFVLPSQRVFLDQQEIQALPERSLRPQLLAYYKPAGMIVSHKDPQGRPTVFEHLPRGTPRWISVGRLDYASEGLLLFTNQGRFARLLELPESRISRTYRVRAFGDCTPSKLAPLTKGVTLGGIRYRPCQIEITHQQGRQTWLSLTLQEGKNREIRNLLEAIGLVVRRLIRVGFGPYSLEGLSPGQWRKEDSRKISFSEASLSPKPSCKSSKSTPRTVK